MQEFGCMKSLARNESKEHLQCFKCDFCHLVQIMTMNATLTGSIAAGKELSKSICNETRKMVNLMCVE